MDGRHLEIEKRPYFRNGLTDLHKIWHGAAFWPSEGYGHLSDLRDLPPTSALKEVPPPIDWYQNGDLEWHEMA